MKKNYKIKISLLLTSVYFTYKIFYINFMETMENKLV